MTGLVPGAAALLPFNPRAPAAPGGDALRLGMTMWFRVRVQDGGGPTPLGMWSGCSGIGVELSTEDVPNGIGQDAPAIAPTALKYNRITLERAVSEQDSARVRAWLESVVADWYLAADGGSPDGYPGATVTIELFSALQPVTGGGDTRVATWTLRNAYPVSWSGPALDANTSRIATEKLVLAHSGFLEPGGRTARPAAASSSAVTGEGGVLRLSHGQEQLLLQFQPAEVSMDRANVYENTGSNTVLQSEKVVDPGKLNFGFTVRVEGRDKVTAAKEKLLRWLEGDPRSTTGGAAAPAGATTVPKLTPKVLDLKVGSGPGLVEHKVILRSVNVSFKRFTAQGDPSRATFALKLEAVDRPPGPTNPTSGGPPGTTVHPVVAGDDLARVAQTAYGSPARWREIAQGNAIDDPLRLRVGTSLLLPGSARR